MRQRLLVLSALAGLLLAVSPALRAQGGHFELSGHYGRWSLNLLGSAAEEVINDAIDTKFRDRIRDSIQADYPNLNVTDYRQVVRFDSSGDNFGAAIRWYPGGRRGSFSLGVSVEKSHFKVLPTAAVLMTLQDQATSLTAGFDGTAEASAIIKATSFLVSLRWDLFPRAVVHPYLTFGGGLSTSKALDDSSVAYSYSGQLTGAAVSSQTVSGSGEETLRGIRNDALADESNDFPVPNFIPFAELNLGLKARITKMLHAFVDVGFFDGFMAAAGLAIRL
ncbi:MAG TPA: hypothetical protein VLN41_00540 [Candidatus Bathyarchaeia archaeon]|nr:hypothetical protein [Candidatus Bathyarchaeia archaeon]